MKINYRSFADLSRDVRKWCRDLPKDIDLIVGIPRSGMLVANLASLILNIPYTDLCGFCEGRFIDTGKRGKERKDSVSMAKVRKAFVVDDSVGSGSALCEAKERVESAGLQGKTIYGAVYVAPGRHKDVDYLHEVLPFPRVFEWNVLNHCILSNSCMDIDGVLCRDPSEKENDDGPRYVKFIEEVDPLVTPTYRIGYLVTCRLEKYRKQTENWLRNHGILYDELIMMDYPDKESRIKAGSHGSFKADAYKETGAALFIESSHRQSVEIAQNSGRSVFCTEAWTMVDPSGRAALLQNDARKVAKYLFRDPGRITNAVKVRTKKAFQKMMSVK